TSFVELSAVSGPATGRRHPMTTHERIGRRADPGLVPETRIVPPNIEEGRVPGGRATVLSAGLMIGPWFRPADGRGWQVLLVAAAIALAALLQLVWLYRARSARRWRAALDAYATREIARERRRSAAPL